VARTAFELVTLGGFELRGAEGGPIALKSRKSRALLAILAVQRSLGMGRAGLAGLLWAERGEAQARGSLRQALAEIRRALGPEGAEVLRSGGERVEIDGTRIAIDVVRFEALVGTGDRAALEEALTLARGPFLEGFDLREDAFDEWRMTETRRVEAALLDALGRLASLCEDDGDLEVALRHVDRALAIAPLGEALHRRGMALCARLGRTTEAIERYRRLESMLEKELGARPEAETRMLYDELRSGGLAARREAAPRASIAPSDAALDGRPSIAVLPFVNLSGDPKQDFFADGMTEDIITELSRFRDLFVIARNSTFVYKGRPVDTPEIARKLGVKYLVEGSVRSGGGRLRISAQLIDAPRRSHIWAEHYDSELSDLFDVRDELVRTLVAAIEPELEHAEQRSAAAASPEQLDAWGAVHRGMWHVYRFTSEDNAQALVFFEQATKAAPSQAAGWIAKSFAHFSNVFLGFADDREAERKRCLQAALRAVELDPRDAAAHWALGRAYSLELDYERAIPELETAVRLNTNHAQSWYQLGWLRVRAGRHRDAIEPLRLAERLSPNDPLRFAFLITRAQAHYQMGEYAPALELAERAARLPHSHAQIGAIRIACLVKVGKEAEAREAMGVFRAAHPEFTQSFFGESHGFAREEDLAGYLEALAAAGLPR
jgi:TolB-like protein/Tfp pilus assembly protein PilF